jgi:hypothetical protein
MATTPSVSQGAGAAKSREANLKTHVNPLRRNLHGLDPMDSREDYLTKSKMASASWSGSEDKIKKARQQARKTDREEKRAAQAQAQEVCDFNNDEEGC